MAVVFNPATGGGDGAGRRRDTEQALAGAGLDVLWLETSRQDPGQGVTRQAVAEGVDLVMARPDDGLLDVAVLQTRTVLDWARLAVRVLLRRRRKDPELEVFRARRVEVRCDRPQPVERDGDPVGATDHLVVEIVPRALTLCVPPAREPKGRNP